MEDNPAEFKFSVHNIFTVRFVTLSGVCRSITKTESSCSYIGDISLMLICRRHRRLFLLEWQASFVCLVSRSILNSIRWSLEPPPPLMTLTVKQTHLLIANQTMSLRGHVALSRLNRKVVPNLLSRKTAVVRNERRLVAKRSFENWMMYLESGTLVDRKEVQLRC